MRGLPSDQPGTRTARRVTGTRPHSRVWHSLNPTSTPAGEGLPMDPVRRPPGVKSRQKGGVENPELLLVFEDSDETLVGEAMRWCRRSGKWAPGTHKNFQEFVRMLQVRSCVSLRL